jgi:hypothetical protein
MATISYNLSDIQQKAQNDAEARALAEGKTAIEADFTDNAAGNLAGPDAITDSDLSNAPAPRDSGTPAEVKTDKATAGEGSTTRETTPGNLMKNDKNSFLPAVEKNILHNYRSWTYNFVLGALTPEALSNNRFLERDINTYTVLNSAGKGTKGVGISNQGENADRTSQQQTSSLIDGFNQNSPGRFDMFIDNFSVESTIAAGSKEGGSSIATNITFDVFEPYSMNGLIEALQVTAKAAGYSDYMKAAFAIRVQFQGWPDTSTNAQHRPEVVPMSTRYFPITICEVSVDVTEAGTRYKIGAVPVPQMGLGTPNKLTSDIKVSGDTVGEILKNFFESLNKMIDDRVKEETKQPGRDRYEISCPKLVTVGNPQNTKASVLSGTTSTAYTSEIVKAKMNDELTSVNVFKMGDPAQTKSGYTGATVAGSTSTNSTANPSTGKITPKGGTVVFSAGSQIHDCIAAVVRDSTYTRDLLRPENLDKVKKGDGLVTYFTVRMETDILGNDDVNNKKFQCYRYVLEPFQLHYTRIPGQEQGNIDLKELKKKIKREYNYIYTGKNEDVLKFALKFDNLYFTAVPAMLGNRPADNQKSKAAGPNNEVQATREKSPVAASDRKNASEAQAPRASTGVDPSENSFESKAKAGQVQADPYAKLAQNLHNAVLNNVDLISGTLEILGDPYYLVTGGMGNTDLNLKEPMLTSDGQAPTTQGALYVNINFKNPVDINSKTGLMDFGKNPISFSGVYQVLQLKNNFKDGVFTQALDIIRIPGQILGNEPEILPSSGKTTPLPGQQLIKDNAPASILKSGIRPSDFNLANLLSRGLPSIGLPGNASNFTNSLLSSAGLTGVSASVSGLLNQASGAIGSANQIANQLGVSPISGVNALTSGVRLAASGLGSLSGTTDLASPAIAAAGKSIGDITSIANAPTQLASNVVGSLSSLPTTAISSVNGLVDSAVGNVTALTQNVKGLATQSFDKVSGLVGDAKNAIAGLQNPIPTDFASVGAKLGIDTSALAGLSPDLASKMATELTDVAKNVPANTDLGALKEQGISFANITKDKLKNLPAIQPKDIAPPALEDPAFAEIATKFGSVSPLLAGKTNLPNLTDLNKVTNPLGTVSAGLTAGFGAAKTALGSISAANSYVNSTIGSSVGLANNVGSLAQNSIQGFSPASIGLGSIESNIATVSNLAQSPTSEFNKLGISVSNQFGSLQSSPLTKLVQSNNIKGIV